MQNPSDDLQKLMQRPTIAWLTIFIFAVAAVLYFSSVIAFLTGRVSLTVGIIVNSIALYLFFTPTHDSAHKALSSSSALTTVIGSISLFFWAPLAPFNVYRYLHMQHHRFTNEKGDPDLFSGSGKWSLPFRWVIMDIYQIYFFIRYSGKFTKNIPAFLAHITLTALVFVLAYQFDCAFNLFLVWIVSTRINLFVLTILLDFLPHFPHGVPQSENMYQATSIRYGAEWLLTPIFLCHNYHLMHHIYPGIPFFRLIKVWKANKSFFLSQEPSMVPAFKLKRRG